MHEYEDLLFVANDAGHAHREAVGSHRRYGQAQGDAPFEIVLHHKFGVHLETHELDDVLECVGRTVEEAAEAKDRVRSVRRGNNLKTCRIRFLKLHY